MTDYVCVVCTRGLEVTAMACLPCRNRLDGVLVEIGLLHAELPSNFERGQAGGQRVSGSREAPLPLRIDPLDLSMPARAHRPTNAAMAHPEDWLGHLPVLSVLDLWVRDWRDVRGMGEKLPVPSGGVLILWLRNRLDWACQVHPAVDDFDTEMRELRAALRTVSGVSGVRPERVEVPCRKCDLLALARLPGEDRIECGNCGDRLTEEEYQRWVRLLAADVVA